jgi:hypothetical protein
MVNRSTIRHARIVASGFGRVSERRAAQNYLDSIVAFEDNAEDVLSAKVYDRIRREAHERLASELHCTREQAEHALFGNR